MKKRNRKTLFVGLSAVFVLLSLLSVSFARALDFNYSDKSFTYLAVRSSSDIASPGNTVFVNVEGQLAINQSLIFTVSFSVDTESQSAYLISSVPLAIPINFSIGTLTNYPVFIPQDALSNTYVSATISDGTTTFSKIPVCLVQNATESEQTTQNSLLSQISDLQVQVNRLQFNNTKLQIMTTALSNQIADLNLQLQDLRNRNTDLQSNNNITSILLYLATFVAATFIVATTFIIVTIMKGKRKTKNNAESPLY